MKGSLILSFGDDEETIRSTKIETGRMHHAEHSDCR